MSINHTEIGSLLNVSVLVLSVVIGSLNFLAMVVALPVML